MAMYRATLWYMGRWGQKIASRTQFDFINFYLTRQYKLGYSKRLFVLQIEAEFIS